MKIVGYSPEMADCWNRLVEIAPTATFLHDRRYMDYHCDRFTDCSVMVFDDKGRAIAALPANVNGTEVVSHGGLTYGGWLVDNRHVTASVLLKVWEAALDHYRSAGYDKMLYKPVPDIYHRYPAQDDIYCLFRLGAVAEGVQISSAIDLRLPLGFDSNARRGAAYARKHGVTVGEGAELSDFWDILSVLLMERYGKSPVHTLDEMRLLMSRFPDRIRLHGAYSDGRLVAGTLIYLTHTVAHAQYICASPAGKELKALPLLFESVIGRYRGCCRYFDFGISTEDGGRYLNEGLLRQKSGMGGRGVVYSAYRLKM